MVATIPADVWRIYCVNDLSPDDTKSVIERLAERDKRVRLIDRTENGGVGAAFMSGVAAALRDKAHVIVKLDGDGQMNGSFVTDFAAPILDGRSGPRRDGNRSYDVEHVLAMPRTRLIGNAGLSFLSKLSTGYWNLFDLRTATSRSMRTSRV